MLLSATTTEDRPDADLHSVQNQNVVFSETSKNGQPYANLHAVENPEHTLVSNK